MVVSLVAREISARRGTAGAALDETGGAPAAAQPCAPG